MGLTPVLFGFTAAVIGGLGSLTGAVLGGYLLGGGHRRAPERAAVRARRLPRRLPVRRRVRADGRCVPADCSTPSVSRSGCERTGSGRRPCCSSASRRSSSPPPTSGRSARTRSIAPSSTPSSVLILALGLSTFVGLSGVFSFGHMAFMAVGAYTTAVLTMSPDPEAAAAPGPAVVAGRRGTSRRSWRSSSAGSSRPSSPSSSPCR